MDTRKMLEVLNGQRPEQFALVLCRLNVVTDLKFSFSVRFL